MNKKALTVLACVVMIATAYAVAGQTTLYGPFSGPVSLPFFDDFEDGNYDEWNIVRGIASIETGSLDGTGNYVLQLYSEAEGRASALCNVDGSLSWSNYQFEADAKLAKGNDAWSYLNFYFYSQSSDNVDNTYLLHLRAKVTGQPQDSFTLAKRVGGITSYLTTVVYPDFAFGVVYNLKVTINNGQMEVYINDKLELTYVDTTFSSGTVGVETHTGGGWWTWVRSHFDNIRVSGLAPLSATIDIDPDTLDLKSKGKWITCYIELPQGYDVRDIDASTILLEDTLLPILDSKHGFAKSKDSYIVDHDSDGVSERMVKFLRADVIELIYELEVGWGDLVEITVTGELYDGTIFEGADTITVINP